nr:O-acetyl-ADP-ribose deacetylase [Serinibacter arcticus]
MGGVVIEALLPPEVELIRGDITRQEVDAVVNAANSGMRGGGGVDGAIHRAGGPAVLADCLARFPRGLAVGDAGWTTAGDLPASRVIHTVGPNHAAGQRDRALLVSCYRRSLEVADELRAGTVAFPLVSAGIYGWPLQDAADAAVETLASTPSGVRLARIVAFSDEAYDAVARALGARGTD